MRSTPGAISSSPSSTIDPSIRKPGMTSLIRLRLRSSVLLPQPLGPMIAVMSPWVAQKSTSRTAWVGP